MIETITQHDLIKLIYQEADQKTTSILKNEIICDEGFAESYYQLQDVKEQLDTMVLSAQSDWTRKVLDYAHQKV